MEVTGLPRLWGTLAQSLALLRRSFNASAIEAFHAVGEATKNTSARSQRTNDR
jgi:hypothetical protein